MTLRRLAFFRHGEAQSAYGVPSDHVRNLTPRGRKEALAVSKNLQQAGFTPDLVLGSDAKRAHETMKIYVDAVSYSGKTVVDRFFYDAGVGDLLDRVYELDDEERQVIFFGHNPTWSDISSHLSGGTLRLPTGSVALLEAEIDAWTAAGQTRWELLGHFKA